MTKLFNNSTYLIIHAQIGKELLIIKNILTQNYFIKTANEIILDIELLNGFSAYEAAMIGIIAGMAINKE